MKRTLSIILAFAVILGAFTALSISADAKTEKLTYKGFTYTINSDNKTATITGCDLTETTDKLYFPNKIQDKYTVTVIGKNSFGNPLNKSPITEIVLPENLVTIESNAFSGCSKIKAVTIPKSVQNINSYAFYNCYNLEEINIPQDNQLAEMGLFVFGNSKWMSKQPNGLVYVGNMLYRCKGKITSCNNIKEGTVGIASVAFKSKSALKNITLPKSIKFIGERAFYGCTNLESITIPEGVTETGEFAFGDCYSLKKVNLPQSLTKLGAKTFAHCKSLKSILLPENLKSLGSCSTFYDCSSLKNITIPKKIKTIGVHTFYMCKKLKKIKFEGTVKNVGKEAYEGTRLLKNKEKGVVYIGNAAICYKGKVPVDTTLKIKKGTYLIASSAFSGCKNITEISIPSSVKNVGKGAFSGTAWYKKQPNGLVYVGKNLYIHKHNHSGKFILEVRPGTYSITAGAFNNGVESYEWKSSTITLYVPSSVKTVGSRIISPKWINATVYCKKGSAMEKYINKNNSGFTLEYN